MSWFRRRAVDPPAAPRGVPQGWEPEARAERFWAGWSEHLPVISAALGDREPQRVETLLCELVAELHPDLHFTIDRGRSGFYALVVSGQEDPRLRPYTDAWKALAPEDGPLWEFHDSVPPVPDPTEVVVTIAGQAVRLGDVRVVAQLDEAEGVVDVAVHHPALGELEEAARQAMTFLPLDVTLGERLAAQRLRRVETAVEPPVNTIGLLELRELVRGLEAYPR